MSKRRPTVTISIHWEGDPESQLYRLPEWLFKTLAVGSVVFVVLVGISAVAYTPIVRTAARVPGLNAEIVRLTEENNQVLTLASTLQDLEQRYDQIRTVLGAEVGLEQPAAERPDGLVVLEALVAKTPARPGNTETPALPCPSTGPSIPSYMEESPGGSRPRATEVSPTTASMWRCRVARRYGRPVAVPWPKRDSIPNTDCLS